MRASLFALFLFWIAVSEVGATQAPSPGQELCFGDGSGLDCPCPSQVLFREDFNEGVLPEGWVADGLWSITDACGGPCG